MFTIGKHTITLAMIIIYVIAGLMAGVLSKIGGYTTERLLARVFGPIPVNIHYTKERE